MIEQHRKKRRPIAIADGQRGVVVLIILISLSLALAGTLLASLSRAARTADTDARTAAVLAQAKESLIGFAVSFYEKTPGQFGFLPCPNLGPTIPPATIPGEGGANGPCGSKYANSLGRLPWKSLGIPPLRDGSGECLWYVVTGPYKNTNTAKSDLLNEDSNGLLEIFSSDATTKIAGTLPDNRPIAAVFAPGAILKGQDRTSLPLGTEACGGNYSPQNYLDTWNGKSNSAISGTANAIDRLISGESKDAQGNVVVNDKLVYITREEIFAAIKKRNDFAQKMEGLTAALGSCVATFGRNKSGGLTDRRLPWPAPIALPDYRRDANYDDHGSAVTALSGRLPNKVNDSHAAKSTGLTTTLIKDCLNAEQFVLWQHWKDHFFYAVSAAHKPNSASVTAPCGPLASCLQVNGSGDYAAIVMFSGSRLASQSRNSPPTDPDEKTTIGNYLEGRNASNYPNTAGDGNYQKSAASAVFNDLLYCIRTDLSVVPCT